MKNDLKISTFIHVLDDNNLWNALKKEKIECDGYVSRYIIDNKDKIGLDNIPLTIKYNSDIITTRSEEEKLIRLLANKTTDKQFQGLYLITNFKDNNYWQQITFYGGEPSINKELLKQAIPYARKVFNDEYTSIVVNTNLTIYDEELFEIYKANDIEVQVSIDGKKEQHDLHRKKRDGTGSFEIVLENILKLKKLGVRVVPMITASDANVDNFSDILCDIIEKLDVDDFGVNILITNSYSIDKSYPLKLAREMIKAYKRIGKKVFDYSFVELYEGILGISKDITKNSCGSGRKITVFPNGKVFSCQALEKHPKNYMGNLTDDFINSENWNYWRKRNKFLNENCLNCEVIGSCGGGCAMGSYNKNKTIYDVDYNQCEYAKVLFKELHNIKY